MKTLRISLFFSFVFFSSSVFADTIPATAKHFTGYFGASCMSAATAQEGFSCILNPCEAQFANQTCSVVPPATIIQHSNVYGTDAYAGYNTVYSCPNGGSVDGTSCINVPPCVAPLVRNATSGVCENPPVVCTPGQTKTLLIVSGTYPPSGTPPTIVLNHDRSATMEQPVTVSQGGCAYNLPLNPNQNTGCSKAASGIMYCRVQATQTGANVSGADTALDAALTTDQTPVPSAKAGCILTQTGESICASTSEKNCGTVNGVQVCVKDQAITSNGLPAAIINGQVTVGETTNVNGQAVRCWNSPTGEPTCINPPVTSTCGAGTLFTCITPEPTAAIPTPPTFGLSHDPKTVTKDTSVTNPDNTLTKTQTTTTDVVGTSPYQVTETYNQAGELLQTVYTGAKLGNGTSVSTAPGDGSDNVNTGQPGNAGSVDGSAMDGIFGTATTAMQGVNGSSYLSSPVTAPSASTCIPIPMNYKKLNYTFDPCSKLALFKEMFGYLLYIMTAFAIYEIATRRPV